MSKQIGTIVFLFFLLTNVSAQEKWNYPETEKKSYLLYSQQKWEELIDYTHEARKNGIDFFYLQARTGIAYYNLKKYNHAIPYFWKAWESDHSQEWLQEYLYYSLVFAGRSVEASKISDKFTASLKQKTGFQKSKPIRAAFEGGYSFNPDFDKLLENAFDEELNINNDYGEAFFLKDYHFESLDFSHQVSPGFLTVSYTHLTLPTTPYV
jgi:tetratricopeptide (TPR) repeat protein